MDFLSLLQKRGLSYAVFGISFSPPKNMDYHMQFLKFISLLKKWTIICNFGNFIPFFVNIDYYMQVSRISFPSLRTLTIIYSFWNFFISSNKHGFSYAISGISIPSPKMWTIICIF